VLSETLFGVRLNMVIEGIFKEEILFTGAKINNKKVDFSVKTRLCD